MVNKKSFAVLKKGLSALLAVLCLCLCVTPIGAQAQNNKKIKVGCFPLNGFYNIASDGTVSGYGADYTKEILDHAGWEYEYVIYSSWVEALEGLSNNEIDLLAPAQHTPERDEKFTFDSFPIGTEYGSLLALSTNDSLIYEDFENFNNLKVGVVPSLVFLDTFNEYEAINNFSVSFSYYKDTPSLVAALNSGDIDAMLVNMMVKTDAMKLLCRFGASPFYYMLSDNAKYLCEDLNKVIDKVSSNHPELQSELSNAYFSEFDKTPLSKEELNYIADCGTLNVACGAKYPPFSYVDEKTGNITGVGSAILNKISEFTGLKFDLKPIPFDKDIKEFMKDSNISLVAGVENDAHLQLHGSNFSDSYLKVSKYFIGKGGTVPDKSKKLKIAVMNSSEAQLSTWAETYPNFEFVRYGSIQDCVDAIHSGKADFMLEDRYSMENVLASPRNQDLSLSPLEVIDSNICFRVMVSDGSEELLTSILNKAIKRIPETDKEKIISDFVQENRYQYSISDFLYQYRFRIATFSVLILILFITLSFAYREKNKAHREIRENEMKLRNITNNINGGVVVLKADKGLNITYANEGFLEMIGCTREAFEKVGGESYLAYVHNEDLHKVREAIDSNQKEMSFELRVKKSDGTYVPALFNCTEGEKIDGNKELYCVILDMTEQNRLLEQLRLEKRRTDLILDRVEEVFYEISLVDHSITTSNSFFAELGWRLPDHVPDSKEKYGQMWHTDAENLEKLRLSTEEMKKKKEPVSVICRIMSMTENRYVWYEVFQHPIISADGEIVSIIGLIRNVDNQVSERERLIEQAQRDALTGLYNKEAFENIVTDTLSKLPGQNHALIFIDLDHFKTLNDTLGHMTGDRAICEAADKLRVIFSNFDVLSRFGGDEFCIFVKNIPHDTLKGKMDWLIDKIHSEYVGEKGSVHITCSCGIACTEDVGFDYGILMKSADEALYFSKEHGRDKYTFNSDMPKKNS